MTRANVGDGIMRRLFVAGNWKMTQTRASAVALAREVAVGAKSAVSEVDVAVAPPFVYLAAVKEALGGSDVRLAAQNAYFEEPGAFTGEVALDMLKDVGCEWVILGHSERRHILGESDELINRKVRAALGKGLGVILCVGELIEEREAGLTETVLDRQMKGGLAGVSAEQMAHVVMAYEPVWAIGTGLTATPAQAESAHAHLRNWLTSRYNSDVAEATRIQYGGSVKPDNAAELLAQPNVDGALVGGASLKAETFLPIVEAAAKSSRT
jgi:triosephosphate isomerase